MMKVDPWLDCCRRRLDFGEFLQIAAEWLAAWLCVFGSLVLVVKLLAPSLWPHVLWIGGITIPVMYLAWQRSQLRRHSRAEGAILLDRKLQTGGLLLALADSPNANWERVLPTDRRRWENALPRVRPTRFARLVLLPLAFAIGACFAPLREAKTEAPASRRAGIAAVEELPEMLKDLEDADALPPEEVKHLREEINKLVDESKASPPTQEKWERLDALKNRLQNRLNERFRTVQTGQQAARRLAEAKKTGNKSLTTEQKRQLEADVARALKNIGDLKKLVPAEVTPKQGTSEKKTSSTQLATKTRAQDRNDPKTGASKTTGSAKPPVTAKSTAARNDTTKSKSENKTVVKQSTPPKKTVGQVPRANKTTTSKTRDLKAPVSKKDVAKPPAAEPKTGTPKAGTPKAGTPKAGLPKTGLPKTGATKTGAPKTGAPKTGTPKTGTPKTGLPKTGLPKTGLPKTGAPKTGLPKTGLPKTGLPKTGTPKTGLPKTGMPKTEVAKPRAAKSGSVKQAAKKTGAGGIPKLPKLPETIPDISPEMIAQMAKMMQSGELQLPEDPQQRAELLKQAQKLLDREGHKLEELQKKYGRQIAEAFRNQRLDPQMFDPKNRGQEVPNVNGGNGTTTSSADKRNKTSFRDVVRPPDFLDMRKAEVVGVTGRAPKVKSPKSAMNDQEQFAGSDPGGETYKRRHRPSHRALVKRYFQNGKKP